MRLDHLWLADFRNYTNAELALDPGLTVVVGDNAQGKTNLLEAVHWLATLSSFRGAPAEAIVRAGSSCAVVRAEGQREGRRVLVEGEIVAGGRDRVQVNRQPLRRARDLLGTLRVTVFSPDDLELVKGGPAARRGELDEMLVSLHPRNDALVSEVERVLRQRNALLKQSGGRLTAEIATTLDVWDTKLDAAGELLAAARSQLVSELAPQLAKAYAEVAGSGEAAAMYVSSWSRAQGGVGLAAELAAHRSEELRRGVTVVGPHRDELDLSIDGSPARTHASQGEQRSLALALRLARQALVADSWGSPPLLLLDDVFSELDAHRSAALLAHLPASQCLLTTAGPIPPGASRVVRVVAGELVEG